MTILRVLYINLRFAVKIICNRSLSLTRILCSVFPHLRSGFVSPDSDACVEGYPRSGNTFLTFMLQRLIPGIKLGHHIHASSHVIQALRYGVPTCVIIRSPEDAVTSLKTAHAPLSVSLLLIEYILFHSTIYKRRNDILIIPLDKLLADIDSEIERIATFINREIRTDETPARAKADFPLYAQQARETAGQNIYMTAMPTEEKRIQSTNVQNIVRRSVLLPIARKWFSKCLNTYAASSN